MSRQHQLTDRQPPLSALEPQGSFRPLSRNLERHDLVAFEPRLRAAIAAFLPHSGHSLHFPEQAALRQVEYLGSERRIILPLYAPPLAAEGIPAASPPAAPLPEQTDLPQENARLLGLYVASGVRAAAVRPLLPALPHLLALVMENLRLYKNSLSDPVTGLFTREHLLATLAGDVERCRDARAARRQAFDEAGAAGGSTGEALQACCPGLLAIRLHSLRSIVLRHGYLFAERIMAALGEGLENSLPPRAMAARTGDFELALLLPDGSEKSCRTMAAKAAAALAGLSLPHTLTREKIRLGAAIGYARYPQDMPGQAFGKPASEQARLLLRNARMASALAGELADKADPLPVLGFAGILAKGGRIVETLPLSRLRVSLGYAAGAMEGQRFSVWADPGQGEPPFFVDENTPFSSLYKGEIALIEVRRDTSLAEVIQLGDPAWNLEAGDTLRLLPGLAPARAPSGEEPRRDPLTGLLHHGDFLARFSEEREKYDAFCLAILRLTPTNGDETEASVAPEPGNQEQGEPIPPGIPENATGGADSYDSSESRPELLMGEAVRLCREMLGHDILGGRFGLTSLIFFHPNLAGPETAALYGALCRRLGEELFQGQGEGRVAAGVAYHPFLSFRKGAVLENCQKALEYGILLPFPHVGLLDSLALTISADKSFSQGDALSALEEYKKALLADRDNGLAWNSLGVCLASLGRHEEARHYFDEALERDPGDVMALYNLGYSCQCLGEKQAAESCYKRCLKQEPEHLFSLLRLGQMAESSALEHGGPKAFARAEKLYARAAGVPGASALALRHLAQLCLRQGKTLEAREHLHEALGKEPQNAQALQMLAAVYLGSGEDAAVAESLARQAVLLRPDLKAGWQTLAKALEALGRPRESREAGLRAKEF